MLPNILVVLIDDVGFGVSEVFGGEVKTPALKKLAAEGLRYNAFHTTAICSPTRASLLTGRNHTRVGSGTIAERAIAFDGFTGVMPRTAATVAEVLHHYGYKTSAFGKWHNTPATETTSMGPFDRWPTGYGFDHFWGFLAGETSQWEPRLTHNTVHVEPPEQEGFHLTEGMADEALKWLDDHQAFRRTSRSLCTGRRAPPTVRITSPKNGRTSTKENLTMAGTPIASAFTSGNWKWASFRKGTKLDRT